MYESGYYPVGAEHDPRAPWNQREDYDIEPIDVEVEYLVRMRKVVTLSTSDYHEEDWEDWERDEEGNTNHIGGKTTVIDKQDFLSDFEEEHYTPQQLLIFLKQEMQRIIEEHPEDQRVKNGFIQHIIDECDNWEYEEEDCGKCID